MLLERERKRRGFGSFFKKVKRPASGTARKAVSAKAALPVSKLLLRELGEVVEAREPRAGMEELD